MSVSIITTLLCNSTRACLLFILILTSHLSICDGSLSKSVKVSTDENTRPETTIPQGTVQGINMVTRHNRTIFGFMGIPYAQPPVGDLRFKAPVSPDTWNGIFDASSEAELCPQFNDQGEIAGSEDCLYLNVFTPQLSTDDGSTLLPVMVFIIGGAFKAGNNSVARHGPNLLLDEDVVLVVPNFRVGVLGFLSTGDDVSPGNYGMKDLVQVLKWVQDSIEYFGGDPNQVTLFGESSGGTSVHLLALSDLTNGLFHKYITQSGTALHVATNAPKEVSANRAIQLGEYLGCPTNSSTLLVDCLRSVNASQLVDTNTLFFVWHTIMSNVWTPTPEPDIEGAFLIDTPANLIAAGKIRDLPWLASVTRDEGLITSLQFYEDPDLFEDFLQNIDLVLPTILQYESVVDDRTTYTDALKSYYLNDLTANRSLLLANLTTLLGDALIVYPTYNAMQQQLVFAESAHYFCSFEYRGTFSHSYLFSGGSTEYTGVVHGDELIYLFNDDEFRFGPSDWEYSEADLTMMNRMLQLWTSFAKNGTPTTKGSASTTVWTPYSSLNNYLRIGNGSDTELEMKYDLYKERMQFWDELTAVTWGTI